MRQDLLARLTLPPRRFRRLVLTAVLLPTLWFSWGVRTQGCNVDTPVALVPPARTFSFANPELWWLVPLALLFVVAPLGVERVQTAAWRALLNVLSALLACLLAVMLVFATVFAQTLFGRLLSLSIAGAVGMSTVGLLVIEAFSWVATDIRAALRARKASGVQRGGEGVVGEEGLAPALGDALEDEGGGVGGPSSGEGVA